METIFMNRKTAKRMKHINLLLTCHKDQTQKSSNKHVSLQNLSVHYTWKNIRKQYKNNKLKIIAPTWNDEFELPNMVAYLKQNSTIDFHVFNTLI